MKAPSSHKRSFAERHNGCEVSTRSFLNAVLVIVLALGCLSLLVGCRESDTLKEIVLDQTAEVVDYDNPLKFLISDSTSDVESDQVPATEVSDDAPAEDEEQNLLIYSSSPNTTGFTAKASVYAEPAQFPGIEASQTVNPYYSDDDDAIDYDVPHEEDEEEPEEEEQDQSSISSKGVNGKSDSGEGDSENPGKKASKKGEAAAQEDDEGAGDGEEVEIVDTTGAFSEPPSVERIAAYGALAVIVQMVGGEGSLVATDADTLESGFSTVFKDEGAGEIVTGWSGDGSSASQMDVDAIVSSGAQAVLTYTSDYQKKLKAADAKKLTKAGVKFVQVYPMVNSTYIKNDVSTVAEMLAESTVLPKEIQEAGGPEKIAKAYAKFHDELIEKCVSENGGKLASASNTTYETKNSIKYSYDATAKYTLLIDAWDSTATYTGKYAGWTPVSDGAGLCTIGWSATPVSYYIQAGGLINNASAKSYDSASGRIFAWQFNANQMPFSKKDWKYEEGGAADASTNVSTNTAQGWGKSLFTITSSSSDGMSSGSGNMGDDGSGVGASFGTESFPKIIVCSQEAKDGIIKNSKDENGIYHPYSYVQGNAEGILFASVGKILDNLIMYSSIGVEGSGALDNVYDGQIDEGDVEVNPEGLVCSWLEGTPEACLEAAWVNDVVNTDSAEVGWKSYAKEYYSQFYRYDGNLSGITG